MTKEINMQHIGKGEQRRPVGLYRSFECGCNGRVTGYSIRLRNVT